MLSHISETAIHRVRAKFRSQTDLLTIKCPSTTQDCCYFGCDFRIIILFVFSYLYIFKSITNTTMLRILKLTQKINEPHYEFHRMSAVLIAYSLNIAA